MTNRSGEDFFDRLCAAADHNHQLLTAAGVEHLFTLVEWNPVRSRQCFADMLVDRLPWWHRTLVVDGEWHQALSTNPRSGVHGVPCEECRHSTQHREGGADDERGCVAVRGARAEARDADTSRTESSTEPSASTTSSRLTTARATSSCSRGTAGRCSAGSTSACASPRVTRTCSSASTPELSGYTFESLGTIYRVGRDGRRASRRNPRWDYQTRYRNPKSWGLSAGIDEPAGNGRVLVHHPLTHGALLSIIVPAACPQHQENAPGTLPTLPVENLAPLVNTALAAAKGQFVVVTADRTLQAFGGSESLITMLTEHHGWSHSAGGFRDPASTARPGAVAWRSVCDAPGSHRHLRRVGRNGARSGDGLLAACR